MLCFCFDPYVAIIGDIVNSKKIQDRDAVQQKLKAALSAVNEDYKAEIASNFMITLGDEFQGLLSTGKHLMDVLTRIEQEMSPVRFRFGIGVGSITTQIQRDWAIGADGPGYHKAREAVAHLKAAENKKENGPADTRIAFEDAPQEIADLLNVTFKLLTAIKQSWSKQQRLVIQDALKHRDSQVKMAGRLGVKQPTIHKHLINGHYYSYLEALSTINRIMAEVNNSNG